MGTLLILVVALPVAMAALMVSRAARGACIRLAWAAPLPALVVALAGPVDPRGLDWLMLGGAVGLDGIARTFLLFTAILWSVSGAFARRYLADDPRRVRFFVFHLLTLSGNLGVIVAQDLASFYAAFAVMTFAGYALVVHDGSREALRAGRIYLVLAVVGETMLLAAFIIAASAATSLSMAHIAAAVAASPHRDLLLILLLGGFGIKAGAVPLHVWLPLAHPVAPTPASAVLSGSMIKAGLLGWLRFLPGGLVSLDGWGSAVLTLGLLAAFFGIIAGVTQRDAKTALAYSSISQMGFMNAAIGIGLASADAWPLALAAVVTYAAHHALAKGALFLGVSVVPAAGGRRARALSMAGMLLAALAIAGAPLTSGAVAKEYLKSIAPLSPVQWPIPLDVLLGIAALGSTLLMARVLLLVRAQPAAVAPGARPLWPPWVVLLSAVAVTVWLLPSHHDVDAYPPTMPALSELWIPVWPVVGGALLAWLLFLRDRRAGARELPRMAPGDVLIPVERLFAGIGKRFRRPAIGEPPEPVASLGAFWYGVYARSDDPHRLAALEERMTRWIVAGLLFIASVAGLVLLLVWSS